MSESISFYKAIDPNNPDCMKAGDRFALDKQPGTNLESIIKKKDGFFYAMDTPGAVALPVSMELFDVTGKIIRAEPKVLGPNELQEEWRDEEITQTCHGVSSGQQQRVRLLINKCRDNFRFERDLELRPLVEKVQEFVHQWCSGDETNIDDWVRLLSETEQKLKPLNEKDEQRKG